MPAVTVHREMFADKSGLDDLDQLIRGHVVFAVGACQSTSIANLVPDVQQVQSEAGHQECRNSDDT